MTQFQTRSTSEVRRVLRFILAELRPKGPLLTPFNLISVPVILCGIGILAVRFVYGLGAVTNQTPSLSLPQRALGVPRQGKRSGARKPRGSADNALPRSRGANTRMGGARLRFPFGAPSRPANGQDEVAP